MKGSKTEQNLLTAFAGECQARSRYEMYAKIARKEGYEQIANFFLETANNEYEHAKLFYRQLKGELVEITASYPAGIIGDTIANLTAAAAGEEAEAEDLYPAYAKTAKAEGFIEISALFTNIATIEKHHQERFLKLLNNINTKKVFVRQESQEWLCLECGYLYKGKEAPAICPVCAHPQAFYEIQAKNY